MSKSLKDSYTKQHKNSANNVVPPSGSHENPAHRQNLTRRLAAYS